MSVKFLDNAGVETFWTSIKKYITDKFYTKESVDSLVQSMHFIGTLAEYKEAESNGTIKEGAIVIITDDHESYNNEIQ